MTILVVGATGNTGGEVLRQLAAAGTQVRALSRGGAGAQRLRDAGTEVIEADLAEPVTLSAALDGVSGVFVAQPASPELPEHEASLAQAAADAGVQLLVQLSVVGAAPDSELEFARVHAAAEAAIAQTGVPLCVLRPNGFMQNTLDWAAQLPSGTIAGPVMDARWSIVDVEDIAAVAVAALSAPGTHAGQAYTLTGPEASSPRDQVAILSELLGTTLAVQDVPIDAFVAQLGQYGVPPWTATRLGELFALYAAGGAETVSDDVALVLGRPATDFRTWAEAHLDAFRSA